MKTIFKALPLFFLVFFQHSFAQYTESINSNIPGMSMSPYAVGKTIVQLETNSYYMSESLKSMDLKGKGYGGNFALRYGAWREEFEAVITGEYRNMNYTSFAREYNVNGLRSLTAGAKYLFYDPFKNYKEEVNVYSYHANHKFKWKRLRPAISGYVGANFNLTDNKFAPVYNTFGPKAMVMLHNNFNNGMILTTNLIGNNFIDETFNYGFILTLSQGFSDKFSLFIENETYFKNYKRQVYTFGATYIVLDDLQVQASVSHSPSTEVIYTNQTYGGIGISWRFDAGYKDIKFEVTPTKDKR